MSFTYLIKLSIRNLFFVNRIRYLFVVSLLVMSIILGILGMGFVDGMEYGILRDQRNIISSDVVFVPAKQKTYQTIHPKDLTTIQQQNFDAWTIRLQSIATIHLPSRYSSVVQIIGYTPQDAGVFAHDDFLVTGRFGDSPTIAIGTGLSEKHDLHIGDSFVVEVQTIKGFLMAKTFQVEAIVDTGNFAFHEILWIPYEDLTEMLGDSIATSIHLRNIHNCKDVPLLKDWQCITAREAAKGMLDINEIRNDVFSIILIILWFLSLSSFFHISWMSILERRKEIYILRTLGLSFKKMVFLLLLEGFLIASLAIVIAIPISYLFCDVIFADGIPLDGLRTSLGSIPLPQKIYILFDIHRSGFISLFCIFSSILMSLPALFWLRIRRGELC